MTRRKLSVVRRSDLATAAAVTIWTAGASILSNMPTAVGTGALAVMIHLFTRRRQIAAAVAGWVYEFDLAEDYVINGQVFASSGAPGYIGKSKRKHPMQRWADENHPVQQGWGKRWLDVRRPTVYPCTSIEEMDTLERELIALRVKQGHLLFNESGVPAERRLPRWKDTGNEPDRDGRVDEGTQEVRGVPVPASGGGVPAEDEQHGRAWLNVCDVPVESPSPTSRY